MLAKKQPVDLVMSRRGESSYLADESDQKQAESLQVSGVVIHGAKLGRTIGFPTANMKISACSALLPGIYAVNFRDAFGAAYMGVASFGRRPTVTDDGELLLETYVLDFCGDLYGQECSVSFVRFLREEAKFESLNAMVKQIERDVAIAREVLEDSKIRGTIALDN